MARSIYSFHGFSSNVCLTLAYSIFVYFHTLFGLFPFLLWSSPFWVDFFCLICFSVSLDYVFLGSYDRGREIRDTERGRVFCDAFQCSRPCPFRLSGPYIVCMTQC